MLANHKKAEKENINIVTMIKRIIPMCIAVKPSYFLFNRTVSLLKGIFIGLNVVISHKFFDPIYKASCGTETVKKCIWMFAIYLAGILFTDILENMDDYSLQIHIQRILGELNRKINRKSATIDPIEYENPRNLDDINKAANGAVPTVKFLFIVAAIVTRYFSYFIFMSIYLVSLKPMLILCMLFVFMPVFIGQILRSPIFSNLEDDVAPMRREMDAYANAASGKEFYKETRNLGSFRYITDLLTQTIHGFNGAVWRTNKRGAKIDFCCNTLSLIGYGGILYLLVKYLLAGEISVGAFVAVYNSIGMLFSKMEEFISRVIGNISLDFGLVRNFLRFLDMKSDNRPDKEFDKQADITASNVSFRYPNMDRDVVRNLNFTIKKGETVAIVGENGAGKTTLVKLITGLYKPTDGYVKIGDTNVNEVSYRSLFHRVSGVFQKYQRYAVTLKENVMISEMDKTFNQDEVENVLLKNDIDMNNKDIFPDGLRTMLSREFNGVDLSGGQWQRIAIARGFYRDSDIIVLDEPTAAIDPLEESWIYSKFAKMSKDKTAIIVTHRIGSAKIADTIIVMKDGEIAETGSHEQLLSRGGLYADMYHAQALWYD